MKPLTDKVSIVKELMRIRTNPSTAFKLTIVAGKWFAILYEYHYSLFFSLSFLKTI
jgi:hypothetical protein